MRVKIGNQWHDSINEPICIQVGRGEQQQIAEMDRSVATHGRYAVFPDSWGGNREAMQQWISDEGVETSSPKDPEGEVTVEMALDQAERATHCADDIGRMLNKLRQAEDDS